MIFRTTYEHLIASNVFVYIHSVRCGSVAMTHERMFAHRSQAIIEKQSSGMEWEQQSTATDIVPACRGEHK